MRVLHLGAGNLFGGIETLLITLATERGLCPMMVPEFGVCFEGQLSRELRDAGVAVHHFGNVRFSRPWTVWQARRRLRRLLKDNPPDAVIAHACWPHSVFAPSVRRAGLPLLFWAHDAAHPEHWLDRRAARTPPNRVIANSRYTLAGMNDLFPKITAEITHCPIRPACGDLSRRAALRGELQSADDSAVILIASRMEAWKGHPSLLEALGLLHHNPRWTCWIAGSAQRPAEIAYLKQLHDLADRLGIAGRLRWLGQRPDIPDLMAAADLYCQPNLEPEPFGIVFIEALYASKPIVATRLGGALEIVDDSCGVLVEPANHPALAATLATMLDNPDWRGRLGSQGPARARRLCGPEQQLHQLLRQIELAKLTHSLASTSPMAV